MMKGVAGELIGIQKSSIAENQPLAGAECADPFMASRYAGPLVGARLLSQVDTTQQAAFLVDGSNRYEETQQHAVMNPAISSQAKSKSSARSDTLGARVPGIGTRARHRLTPNNGKQRNRQPRDLSLAFCARGK